MKKTGLLLLSLLLLLMGTVGLCACDKKNGKDPAWGSDIQLVADGRAQYTVVYPDGASERLFNAVDTFTKAIYRLTGARMDAVKSSMIQLAQNDRYILIGETSLEESSTAKAALDECIDSYIIAQTGDHLTVSASYDAALCAALTHYQESLMEKNYDQDAGILYFEAYTNQGTTLPPSSFDKANLDKYVIVYPGNNATYKTIATFLKEQIEIMTGKNLPVVSSTTGIHPYEILVGNTGHPLSLKAYADGIDVMKASILVENGQLQLVSGGAYSARREIENFAKGFFRSDDESLSDGTHYALDLIPNTHALTEGSDARVMTLNILADYVVQAKDQEALPVEVRAEIFAGMLIRYAPDMIGMQECDGAWVRQIKEYLPILKDQYGLDYRLILTTYGKVENVTTICYNANRFVLDEAQYHPYAYKPITDYSTRTARGAAVAKLTSVSDPSVQILLFSSHWDHTSEDAMNSCATEEAELVRSYQQKYPNATVFCTGDFNSHKFKGVYLQQFVSEIKGAIASDLARANGTLAVDGGYHSAGFIDHIIGPKDGYSVLYHTTIRENNCLVMTDHAPIFADVSLH